MYLVVSTYMRGRDSTGKAVEWERRGSPCVTSTSYPDVSAMRIELRARFRKSYRIVDIPDGLRLEPIPPAGTGEAWQNVTIQGKKR